ADSWPIILLVRFSDRVGKGIRSAPRDSLVAAYSDAKNRGRSFGFHRMMDTSGAVLGIMIAAVFMALMVNPYQELFLLSVVPGALAVFILMMLVKEKKLEEKKRTVSSFRLELKKFDFRFKIAIAAVIIFSMGNFSYAFSLIRAQEMGVVLVAIPLVYLFCNIIYAIAAYPAGILADRLGKDKVLLSSFILFTIISFAFGFLEGALAAWVIFALYGVFLAVFEVSSKAFVADVAPAELRGTALGIYHAGIGFAAFPASFVLGVLWQGFGSGVGFGYSGILAIVATLLLFLFLIKSGDNSDENEPSGKG
ncbi:MAG: MFS transporter, partial [Candidatus Altiarchaeota archaeon]|nr:MFS transporter [Candidatus Altiarchaeota archaeon]